MVTRPVFDALFGTSDFSRHNSVAQGMQTVIDVLKPENFESELESLQGFYDSVRRRVQHASGPGARQKILVELYDKFFRNAFPTLTQRLGIVYTPVEVVDFIIRSVQDVLQDEFATSLGSSRTSTSWTPSPAQAPSSPASSSPACYPGRRSSTNSAATRHPPQIHANDIVLLAYYIASANIETAFQDATGSEYRPVRRHLPRRHLRAQRRRKPPRGDLSPQFRPPDAPEGSRYPRHHRQSTLVYVARKPMNDNAANRHLPFPRYARIRNTYAKHSNRQKLKNSLYDSYIRAIRWASDRIGNQGVIGFVTGSAWIERSFRRRPPKMPL